MRLHEYRPQTADESDSEEALVMLCPYSQAVRFLSDAIRLRPPSLESTTQPVKVNHPCPGRTSQEELLWLDIPALATPLISHVHRPGLGLSSPSQYCEMGAHRFCTKYAYVAGYLLVNLAVAYYKILAMLDARPAVESELRVVSVGLRIMNYVTSAKTMGGHVKWYGGVAS